MDFVTEHVKGFGSLFYMVNPYETMFEKPEDLPHPNWSNVIKLFTAVIYKFLYYARVLVPSKPLQSSLMLVGKGQEESTPRVEHLKGSSMW
jgi:hypothetical protein